MHQHFTPRHNLPKRVYDSLVGREEQIAEIFQRLSPEGRDWIIQIEGLGGIGKSALALEVAWRIAEPGPQLPHTARFNAVVWVSAQRERLTTEAIIVSPTASTNVDDVYRAIARTLEHEEIIAVDRIEQPAAVVRAMRRAGRLLLVIDNLDQCDDPQIAAFLLDLPPDLEVKVLLTTRGQTFRDHESYACRPIRLEPLDEIHVREVIRQESKRHQLSLDEEAIRQILELARGMPLAAVWAVGYLNGYGTLADLASAQPPRAEVLLRYIFSRSVDQVRRNDPRAFYALLALTFFDQRLGATSGALAAVLECEVAECEDALRVVRDLSLVNVRPTKFGTRYTMLPIVHQYLDQRLCREGEWAKWARQRWVTWYRTHMAEECGGQDWANWAHQFSVLRAEWPNLLLVFEWCAQHSQYDHLRILWNRDHLRDFANICGYWSDRSRWLDWLIARADALGDEATLVDCLAARAYTLIHMGTPHHLAEAKVLLERGWARRTSATDAAVLDLAIGFVLLYERLDDLEQASRYLAKYEQLLRQRNIQGRAYDRWYIELLYYRGMLHERRDVARAREFFQRMYDHGAAVGYDRAMIFALNHLADIAWREARQAPPAERQALYQQAERYLRAGMARRECAMDRRRYACFLETDALLAEARHDPERRDLERAGQRAAEALDIFDSLGMTPRNRARLEDLKRSTGAAAHT